MNKLSSFVKNVIGSDDKIFDISSSISPSGDFERVSDIDVILHSWYVILMTPVGTYDHDPNFGSSLLNYIFEPADENTVDLIKSEITSKLYQYDNRALISNIDVQFLTNKKGFVISMDVEFNGSKKRLQSVINENNYFNFLTQ